MPLTNKEKQNRYVQRVKASGQYEEHKKKRAAAVKKWEFHQVSVMEPAGNYWKWPVPKDSIFYMKEKMISKLDVPEVANNRGHFKFSVEI